MTRLFVAVVLVVASSRLLVIPPAPQSVPKWKLTEAWRKGGAVEGAYSFDKISDRGGALAVMPDGRVVVLDPAAAQLRFLDSTGAIVRTVAKQGSGPGEFRRGWGLAVAADGRIAVNDMENGRFVLFKANGDFDRTVPIMRRPIFAYDLAWDASFDRDGRLLESVSIRARAPKPVPGLPPGSPFLDSTLVTERWTRDFARSDSLSMCGAPPPLVLHTTQHYMRVMPGPVLEDGKRASSAVGWYDVPFAVQSKYYARDRDGFEWAPSAVGSGELLRRESGKCATVVARVTLRGPRSAIPAARWDSAFNIAKGDPELRTRMVKTYPWFHALHVDDENRLWVERDVTGGKRFDVFASDGKPVAELDAPPGLEVTYPIAIARGRLYGFVKSKDDVPYLVAWRIAMIVR